MKSSVPASADAHRRHSDGPVDEAGAGHDAVPVFDLDAFKAVYREAAYFSTGRAWSDYVPAYQYGRDAFALRQALRFDDIEEELEQGWDRYKPPSRLAWAEARGAVEHAWRVAKEGAHVPASAAGPG